MEKGGLDFENSFEMLLCGCGQEAGLRPELDLQRPHPKPGMVLMTVTSVLGRQR